MLTWSESSVFQPGRPRRTHSWSKRSSQCRTRGLLEARAGGSAIVTDSNQRGAVESSLSRRFFEAEAEIEAVLWPARDPGMELLSVQSSPKFLPLSLR